MDLKYGPEIWTSNMDLKWLLLGPKGVGKTTTVAKIAAEYALRL